MDIEKMMDAKAVARRLGITVSAVHRLVGRGTLSSMMMGGIRLFRRDVVEAYLANKEQQWKRPSIQQEVRVRLAEKSMTVNEALADAVRRKRESL